MVEGFEDVGASLAADCQPPEAAEPSERAFHHPAMPSETFGAVDTAPGNPRLDGAPPQHPSAMREVIALISMELCRSPLRYADAMADRRHRLDHRREEAAVVDVCRGKAQGEWDALDIGPLASVMRWRLDPARPRSVGLGPVSSPPFGGNRGTVHASVAPVDGARPAQAVE